jgi:hypothetical protein
MQQNRLPRTPLPPGPHGLAPVLTFADAYLRRRRRASVEGRCYILVKEYPKWHDAAP